MDSSTSHPQHPHDPPFGAAPRPLTEEVLQSAEEAVLARPPLVDPPRHAPGSDHTGPAIPHGPATDRLARLVAEKPAQSALVALVAGALVAAVLKRALRRAPRR